jgi:hypothetical protein
MKPVRSARWSALGAVKARWVGVFATVFLASVGFSSEPAVTFGLRLRPAPTSWSEVHAPVVLRGAPTNETSLVRRADGTIELYAVAKPASDAVEVIRSRDGGMTWSGPERAFKLPAPAYYALQVLEASDGSLHAVVHGLGDGPGGYRGRLYEVYHFRRASGTADWSAPQRIVPGYVGSIRGFIQLRNGRLLLAVGRAVPDREKPPINPPDFGWNDTLVYLSDDQGETWRQSPDVLRLEVPGRGVTRYGAIEPALLELERGRVWMLVRDRGGRLWESRSSDGGRWPALTRTDFISSDSPAACLRLRDGRIVLLTNGCQNWSDPRSYAAGGREVLHAALSADDGVTWRGFREVLHDTPTEAKGDRGTAYPTLVENSFGKLVLASGQGEGKRALATFDPAWLLESEAQDNLTAGPVGWTAYGGAKLEVRRRHEGATLQVAAETVAAGASWNFPLASSGELSLRVWSRAAPSDVRLSLTDHFSRGDDTKAAEHAVYTCALRGVGLAQPLAESGELITIKWDLQRATIRTGEAGTAAQLQAQRAPVRGLNYLRIDLPAGVTVEIGGLRMSAGR